MGKVHVTIDGIQVYVPDTYTVLEAAKEINIHIPTLCFLKDVSEIGCCRMCLVEVKGTRALQAACGYPVKDGMEVRTHTPEIMKVRQKTLELILSNHPARCQSCTRTNSCELQILTDKMDVHFENYVKYQEHITSDQPLSIDEGISILGTESAASIWLWQPIGTLITIWDRASWRRIFGSGSGRSD